MMALTMTDEQEQEHKAHVYRRVELLDEYAFRKMTDAADSAFVELSATRERLATLAAELADVYFGIDAGRAALAASQAECAALREALGHYDTRAYHSEREPDGQIQWVAEQALKSIPGSDAALRAMVERTFDATLEATRSHCPCDAEKSWSRAEIVARVLGGGHE